MVSSRDTERERGIISFATRSRSRSPVVSEPHARSDHFFTGHYRNRRCLVCLDHPECASPFLLLLPLPPVVRNACEFSGSVFRLFSGYGEETERPCRNPGTAPGQVASLDHSSLPTGTNHVSHLFYLHQIQIYDSRKPKVLETLGNSGNSLFFWAKFLYRNFLIPNFYRKKMKKFFFPRTAAHPGE